MIFSLGLLSDYEYNKVNQKSDMKSLPKKSPKSISKVRKSGVQISRGEVFKLAGVHTNTYILIPIGEDFSEKYPNQITNC